MNEFVPKGEQQPLPSAQPQAQPLEVRASLELAKVTQNPQLLELIGRAANLAQFQQFRVIENSVQYDQAIDAFQQAKDVIKALEDLRHSIVDFPTKVVSMVNAMFKGVRDGAEVTKSHLGQLIAVKKQADEAAAARAAEAQAQAGLAEPQVVEGADGQRTVDFGDAPPPVPGNVVSSAKGAKVHTRTDTTVTITNLELFLKALVSKNKRNLWLSEARDELVEVKMGALKRLISENKKKKIPGVKIEQVKKTI